MEFISTNSMNIQTDGKKKRNSLKNQLATIEHFVVKESEGSNNTIQGKLASLRGQTTLEEDKSVLESSKQKEDLTEEESKTDTQILVRPDGSRVLLIKVMVAGMETTMSLKLSEATDMQNDSHPEEQEVSEESVGENLEMADMAEEMVSGELK